MTTEVLRLPALRGREAAGTRGSVSDLEAEAGAPRKFGVRRGAFGVRRGAVVDGSADGGDVDGVAAGSHRAGAERPDIAGRQRSRHKSARRAEGASWGGERRRTQAVASQIVLTASVIPGHKGARQLRADRELPAVASENFDVDRRAQPRVVQLQLMDVAPGHAEDVDLHVPEIVAGRLPDGEHVVNIARFREVGEVVSAGHLAGGYRACLVPYRERVVFHGALDTGGPFHLDPVLVAGVGRPLDGYDTGERAGAAQPVGISRLAAGEEGKRRRGRGETGGQVDIAHRNPAERPDEDRKSTRLNS